MIHRQKKWAALAGLVAVVLITARPAAGLLVDMASHWASPLVGALEARGIVSGDEDLRFHPEEPLTRAQLAKLLVTGLGYSDDARLLGGYSSRFQDVPNWHWAKGYVESLAETGAVEGYPGERFGPEDNVTRAQMAVILSRAVGLSDQARLMSFERTGYKDDADVPDWARGFINVARVAGVMEGFEDNTFRPNLPVTRAEGATALFRFLSLKGRVFQISGTLLRFDPVSRQGTVHDSLGRDQEFTMSLNAQYYRAGVPAYAGLIHPLDQVWISVGPDGSGTFLDARFDDRMGQNIVVNGQSVSVTWADGGTRTLLMSPGALIFLNGKPAALEQLNGASLAFVALNRVTGDIRVLDAVNVTARGTFVGLDSRIPTLVLEDQEKRISVLTLATDAVYVLNGAPAKAEDLRIGDRLQVVQSQAGAVTYVLAER